VIKQVRWGNLGLRFLTADVGGLTRINADKMAFCFLNCFCDKAGAMGEFGIAFFNRRCRRINAD
jgi:hypothetical protein